MKSETKTVKQRTRPEDLLTKAVIFFKKSELEALTKIARQQGVSRSLLIREATRRMWLKKAATKRMSASV